MATAKLTIATTDYDHFRDFRLGYVKAEGIEQTWLTLGHHEIFARFTFNRGWEVSELSFAKSCAQVTREAPDIIGLPVVCSRLFRFSSFYVNKNSGIKTAADLKGKRIGSPEWAHTAAVYMRGWLNDEHGVTLKDVHWYQAGANEPGRIEKVELNLPDGVKLERLLDPAVSRYPLAWLPTYARTMRDMFGGDPFPYGIDENRPTLEQFLRYTCEQGIAHRHAKPEEIFPKGIMTSVRV